VATILDAAHPTGQDQIVAQVSEPSTLLVMGLAFFGFAMLARRRTVAI
jgi:PEP-CTERM motif